nr:MoaD/ThiS family protein [Pacificimonas pallii]
MLYFANVRETIGRGAETRTFGDDVKTVADVLKALGDGNDTYAAAFARPEGLRFALDQMFVGVDARLRDGAELGIFPPVTGG